MPFSWKDELLLREAAAGAGRRPAGEPCGHQRNDAPGGYSHWPPPGEAFLAALGEWPDDQAARLAALDRFLTEGDARYEAEQRAIDFRGAAETWCRRAQEYCRQRNRLIWCLALVAGWALGVTWMLVGRA